MSMFINFIWNYAVGANSSSALQNTETNTHRGNKIWTTPAEFYTCHLQHKFTQLIQFATQFWYSLRCKHFYILPLEYRVQLKLVAAGVSGNFLDVVCLEKTDFQNMTCIYDHIMKEKHISEDENCN
jgi:hypothetical protein